MKVREFFAHLPFALAILAIPVLFLVGGPQASAKWGPVVIIPGLAASILLAIAFLILDRIVRTQEAIARQGAEHGD